MSSPAIGLPHAPDINRLAAIPAGASWTDHVTTILENEAKDELNTSGASSVSDVGSDFFKGEFDNGKYVILTSTQKENVELGPPIQVSAILTYTKDFNAAPVEKKTSGFNESVFFNTSKILTDNRRLFDAGWDAEDGNNTTARSNANEEPNTAQTENRNTPDEEKIEEEVMMNEGQVHGTQEGIGGGLSRDEEPCSDEIAEATGNDNIRHVTDLLESIEDETILDSIQHSVRLPRL